MTIDLHLHSTFSDGALTPAELVAVAQARGVGVIAIADHDSVAGIKDGTAACLVSGITIVPAVELSVQFESWSDVHLLGYGIDCSDELFLQCLSGFRQHREQRSGEILARVNETLRSEGRTEITREEVVSSARDALGRPHIARAMLKRGYADTMEDAFQRYLIPCAVPKKYWPIDDAIEEIHRIGGVAVLAHPTSISKDQAELRGIIAALHALGLDGIEVFNNMAWPIEMEHLRRVAEDFGLIVTAGSDFHGIEQGLEIGRGRSGVCFDDSLLPPLYERMRKRHR